MDGLDIIFADEEPTQRMYPTSANVAIDTFFTVSDSEGCSLGSHEDEQFDSEEAAVAKAREHAQRFPGKAFYVMKTTHCAFVGLITLSAEG